MAASNTRETAAMTLPLCLLTAIIGEGRAPDKGRAGLARALFVEQPLIHAQGVDFLLAHFDFTGLFWGSFNPRQQTILPH